MNEIHTDVAILGAGSAGCTAALAASRLGVKTAIIDRLGFPGGTSTAVLDTFYAFFTAGENGRKIVSGLPDLPVERLSLRGAVRARPNSFGSGTGYTYDPEMLKIVWAQLLSEHKVNVFLHTLVVDTETDGDRITSVLLAGKGGLIRLYAHTFIDATGDADVVERAGGEMLQDTELNQPATLTFRVSPVDFERYRESGRPNMRHLVQTAREAGFKLPGSGGSLHESGVPGTALTALVRVDSPDLNDPAESGRMEMEALLQADEWFRFLQGWVPGFEKARFSAIATMTGVRETRRIEGRHILTEDEVVEGMRFKDPIALCGAPIEDLSDESTRWRHVGGSGIYGIPWRSLVPVRLKGVVVAGRCLSATHAAHASARSMGTCMAMGQAAGTASAIAVIDGQSVDEIAYAKLRSQLVQDGVILEEYS